MEPTGPTPWILVSPDRLSARLKVPRGCHVDLALLRDLLASSGVKHGIDPEVLRDACQRSAEDRDQVVASGIPPPGLGHLVITPALAVGTKVVAGQVIAGSNHQGVVAGLGVDGQPVPALLLDAIGCGLQLQEDGTIVARRDGVLRKGSDGGLKVMIDGVAEVAVATVLIGCDERSVEAWIDLLPRHFIRAAVLQQALVEQRIVRGLNGDLFAAASLPSDQVRRLPVATGVAPCAGVDGTLEMVIDEGVHLRVDTHGRVDWHDHGRIEDVAAGAPLARILPPTTGTHGVDVRGARLEPKPGRPLDPARVMGPGTGLDPGHPERIQAATPGHFHRDRQRRLCVEPRLIVEGDVDFRHGNIDTKMSVLVKGDIKAGFTVKSAGDIEVMGVVEDARVTAQGSLVVRGGILPGSQRVKAHGDVHARYVANREIKCHSLRANGSLRWSRIMATGEVMAKEILAGEVIAAGNVTVDQLGNADGIPTRLQVGTNPFEERQFITAKEEHERLSHEVTTGKEHCKLIAHRLINDPSLGDELRTALTEFSAACTHLATCEAVLARQAERHAERARQQVTALIQVNGTAYRGSELVFDEVAKLVVEKDLTRPCFRITEGAIVW